MNTQKISDMSDKAITNTMDAVKSHPGITALVGLGLSWVAFHTALRQKTATERVTQKLQETKDQFMEKLPVQESMEAVTDKSRAIADAVTDKSRSIAANVSNYMKSGSIVDDVSNFMDENPLIVGFIGLSAGVILGILTSGVLSGNSAIDETRRAVKEKTKQLMYETKQRAGNVIDAARQAVKQGADQMMPH